MTSCAFAVPAGRVTLAKPWAPCPTSTHLSPCSEPRHRQPARLRPTCSTAPTRARTSSSSLPRLRADAFRHPVDTQATRVLGSLVGLEFVLRRILASVEQLMFMDNVSTSVRVGEKQLPHLHQAMLTAARELDLPDPLPQLYVRQNPTPNAYTLAFQGKVPFIVIHTALIDLLSEDEVRAVIAHEMGHLKCEHGIYVTMANIIAILSSYVVRGEMGAAVSEWINYQVLRWLRAAELSCDRAALLVTGDPRVVMSVIMKLSGGSMSTAGDLDVDEWMKQASDFDEVSRTPFGRLARRAMTETLTHPLPVLRARELDRYAKSKEFDRLMALRNKRSEPSRDTMM